MRFRVENLGDYLPWAIAPILAVLISLRFVLGVASDAIRSAPPGPAADAVHGQVFSFAAFTVLGIATIFGLAWFVLTRPSPRYVRPTPRPRPPVRDATGSPLWDREMDARP